LKGQGILEHAGKSTDSFEVVVHIDE